MGHRPQSGGRPDAQPRRLSAPRRDSRDRPRAGTRKTLAQQFLDARHQRRCRQDAGRIADQAARREEDRRHGRDGQHRRRLRHRPVERGAAGDHQREIQARLRQELSDRHAGSRAHHQRGEGAQSGCLHRLQLSAGYAGADRAIAYRRLQSENILYRRRHRLPALSQKVRQEHRRRDGHRRLERRQPGDQGLSRPSQGLRRQRRRAGPLGQRGHLRQPADAAAGDRTRRQDRPRRRHQGPADRLVRYRDRQGQAREQHADALLVGRPVAGRRVLRHRTGAATKARAPRSCRSRRGWRRNVTPARPVLS